MISRSPDVVGRIRGWILGPSGRSEDESGSAIIEFVFVAVLVLVPLIYLVVAVAAVQRGRLAVTGAARDVGRAIATTPSGGDVRARATAALRISLSGYGLEPANVEVRYVGADQACDAAAIDPQLTPGSRFAVCVSTREQLPAVPSVLDGGGVRLTGRYVVHVDEFRATG